MKIEKIKSNSFQDIVILIENSRKRVFTKINQELVQLYWKVGEYISLKIEKENWGKSTVKELAQFINNENPEIKGFSHSNLWRMKQFYETYNENKKLATLWRVLSWSQNRTIFSRCKSDEEREFYLNIAVKNRLSVRRLDKEIDSGSFERTMLAEGKLSEAIKKLPQKSEKIFKDSYLLDFLNLPENHSEKDLQKSILLSLKDFIMELGGDFAFLGEEYRLQVGNSDFFIDLLFFHRELNCLVAFELKIGAFKPAHLGQLEFYLEALDRDIKKESENPSIGILLCRDKDDEVVEYALSRSLSPTVVSDYQTKLIPKEVLRVKMNELYDVLEKKENDENG